MIYSSLTAQSESFSILTVLSALPSIQRLPVYTSLHFSIVSFQAGNSPLLIFRFRCEDLYCCCSPPSSPAPPSAVEKSATFIFQTIFHSSSQAPTLHMPNYCIFIPIFSIVPSLTAPPLSVTPIA